MAAPRGIVQTPLGGVHYVTSGDFASPLTPIVAFHMSPRSVDEYTEAMPLLSHDGRLVVAIDELGYGNSDIPKRSCTLEEIAENALVVLEHLGIKDFICCGSLMGNFFSVSLAAKNPARVKGLVLTNCYVFPDEKVEAAKAKEAAGEALKDDWELKEDGSHLTDLFASRKSWLDPYINTRVTHDDLTYRLKRKLRYAAGINIQDGPLFPFAEAAKQVQCPVLAITGKDGAAFFDMIGFKWTESYAKLPTFWEGMEEESIEGGHINCVTTHAGPWSEKVKAFLKGKDL